MSVAVLVPVLNRPHRIAPLVRNIRAATPEPHSILFICDVNDRKTHREIIRQGVDLIAPGGNYAHKIREGVQATTDPLLFLAADDLEFQPGWLPAAVAHMTAHIEVVGVNDLIARRRHHATHFLMTRAYAEMPTVDGQPGPLCAEYDHSFCDDELIATAKHRGVYAYAGDSHVRHDHPMVGRADDDDTYRRGRAQFRHDRRRFHDRSRLWA